MNVLMVEPKDFIRGQISLDTLKRSLYRYSAFQDFIYMPLKNGGILVLKDRYGDTGIFFSE